MSSVPKCLGPCKQFLDRKHRVWDSHDLCPACRPCSRRKACPLCVDFTPENWRALEAWGKARGAKKAAKPRASSSSRGSSARGEKASKGSSTPMESTSSKGSTSSTAAASKGSSRVSTTKAVKAKKVERSHKSVSIASTRLRVSGAGESSSGSASLEGVASQEAISGSEGVMATVAMASATSVPESRLNPTQGVVSRSVNPEPVPTPVVSRSVNSVPVATVVSRSVNSVPVATGSEGVMATGAVTSSRLSAPESRLVYPAPRALFHGQLTLRPVRERRFLLRVCPLFHGRLIPVPWQRRGFPEP